MAEKDVVESRMTQQRQSKERRGRELNDTATVKQGEVESRMTQQRQSN